MSALAAFARTSLAFRRQNPGDASGDPPKKFRPSSECALFPMNVS